MHLACRSDVLTNLEDTCCLIEVESRNSQVLGAQYFLLILLQQGWWDNCLKCCLSHLDFVKEVFLSAAAWRDVACTVTTILEVKIDPSLPFHSTPKKYRFPRLATLLSRSKERCDFSRIKVFLALCFVFLQEFEFAFSIKLFLFFSLLKFAGFVLLLFFLLIFSFLLLRNLDHFRGFGSITQTNLAFGSWVLLILESTRWAEINGPGYLFLLNLKQIIDFTLFGVWSSFLANDVNNFLDLWRIRFSLGKCCINLWTGEWHSHQLFLKFGLA